MYSRILIALMFLATGASAQFNRGVYFVGGSATLINWQNNSVGQTTSNTVFNFKPFGGHFVLPNLAIGPQLGLSVSKFKFEQANTSPAVTNELEFDLGLRVRRYFALSEKFYFLVDGNFLYGILKHDSDSSPATTRSHFTLSLTPVFAFFPTPAWSVEAGIGALAYELWVDKASPDSSVAFSLSAGTVSMGLSYYFRRGE